MSDEVKTKMMQGIETSEYTSKIQDAFKVSDVDIDGKLNEQEFIAFQGMR